MNLFDYIMSHSKCYRGQGNSAKPTGIVVHDTAGGNPNISRYVQPYEGEAEYDELIEKLGKNKYKNDWNHSNREAGVHAFIGKLADGSIATCHCLPYDKCAWGVGRGRMMPKGTQTYLDKACSLLGPKLPCDTLGSVTGSTKNADGAKVKYVSVKISGNTSTLYCKAGNGLSYNFNPNARIQFEICDDGYKDETYFNAAMKEAQEYCAYLCWKFKFDPLTQICSHYESYHAGYGCNHGDCDGWLEAFGKDMDWFRAEVKKIFNKEYRIRGTYHYVDTDGNKIYDDQINDSYLKDQQIKRAAKKIDGYTCDEDVFRTRATHDFEHTFVYKAIPQTDEKPVEAAPVEEIPEKKKKVVYKLVQYTTLPKWVYFLYQLYLIIFKKTSCFIETDSDGSYYGVFASYNNEGDAISGLQTFKATKNLELKIKRVEIDAEE